MAPVPYNKDRQAVELPGTRRPGQTGIYRRCGYENALRSVPESRPHVTTVYKAFMNGLRLSPNGPLLGQRKLDGTTGKYGAYEWQTYSEVSGRINRFGSGMTKLYQEAMGLSLNEPLPQQWTFGLWAINRPEWTIASEAGSAFNLVSVGLYDTLGPEAVIYGVNHSECAVVVASVDHIAGLLRDSAKMSGLQIIISMDPLQDPLASGQKNASQSAMAGSILRTYAKDKGILLYDWDEVEAIGRQFPRKHTPPEPKDIYTICYTSGTTGMPKGAILTHGNYIAALASGDSGTPFGPDDCIFSFLPLAHLFGRAMEIFLFTAGGKVGYSTGDPLLILDDLQALQPTVFPAVPRLLNRIYAKVHAATAGAPGLAGILARKGLATKLDNLEKGLGNEHALWDRLLFSKVKMALGGKVRRILTASAPISAEVLAFIRVVFICEVCEAYGQTEGSGVGTATQEGEMEAGHVGPPNPVTELKLVDVPELNYFTTDKPYPRGEICVRGPNVIQGYLKDEKKTREAIDEEGWLHSGDIGFIKENGTLTVIDRIKNVFKLSIGEYVAVEKIEYMIASRIPIVMQFMVHGDSQESCLVGIVVPEPEAFVPFVNSVLGDASPKLVLGDVDGLHKASRDPKVRRAVLRELTQAGVAAGMKSFEIPKAILIEPEPFTIEKEFLTPTLKLKRHPIVQAYRKQLEELYVETRAGVDSKL
ncbi:long-chain acyl-CoA synthetase [Entomortierella parvispora]|uniref:Long-chain acyl-CoA synthetase n=1 Tax=Entomortierella parvispora TaxID=205924 RepID=A0A9P3M247_9FUNG|nr:long-chain acyl-CoA synthetase [Entomortierella parvispora]